MNPFGIANFFFSVAQLMCTLQAAPVSESRSSVELSKKERVVDAIGQLQSVSSFDDIGKLVSKMVSFTEEAGNTSEFPAQTDTILCSLERINRTISALPQNADTKLQLAGTIDLVAGLAVAETQRFQRLPTMVSRYLEFQTDKIEKTANVAKRLEYTRATVRLIRAYVSVIRDPAFLDKVDKVRLGTAGSAGANTNTRIGSSDELLKLLQEEEIQDVPSVTLVLHLLFLFSATGILTPVVCFGSTFFKSGASVCEAFVSSITWQEFTVIVEMVRRLRQE